MATGYNQRVLRWNADLAYQFLPNRQGELTLYAFDLLHLLLHHLPKPPYTVLVTSSQEHAVQTYDYAVTDYLVKPITFPRFWQAACKAVVMAAEVAAIPEPTDFIFVRVGTQFTRVNFADVYYLEARERCVHIRFKDRELVVLTSLRALRQRFPAAGFFLIHRAFFVNIRHIESVEEQTLLIQRRRLPISALLRPQLLEQLNRL